MGDPLVFQDGSLSEELIAILRKGDSTPQALVDWLEDEGLSTPSSIGGITKEEERVPAMLTTLLPRQETLRIRHKSVVVRVWWLCRTAMTKEGMLSTGQVASANSDSPLDAEITDPCHSQWIPKCGYRILTGRLLVETTLRSVWNELCSKPRKLLVRLAENLRTQACFSKNSDRSAVIFRPGQAPTATVDINDEVSDKYNLWLRIRAWLFSIFFLTISEFKFLTRARPTLTASCCWSSRISAFMALQPRCLIT